MLNALEQWRRSTIRAAMAQPATTLLLALAIATAHGPGRVAADNGRRGADYFPNVTFTTQHGTPVRFYDDLIKGKIVAIDLIYTTCQYACPLETAKLAQVQRLLGDRVGRDVFFYSITIDPEHDTPAVLKEYAERYHARPGWLFLTGSKADIELVGKKLGLYAERDRATPDGHVPYLLVGNEATGQWMRNSALDNPAFLARTIGDWLDSWQSARTEPLKSYADVPRLAFDKGQYTFANHCAACHTIGRGDHIGPDLRGVTASRDRAWLSRFIVEPDRMMAEGDPIALALRDRYKQVRMPTLDLTDEDAAALIDYIDRQSRAEAQVRPAGPAAGEKKVAAGAPPVDLKPVVGAYLRIQQALHADTLDGVTAAARAIASTAGTLGAGGEPIGSAAVKFEHASDVDAARAVFGKVGDALMMFAAERNVDLGNDVRVAYCPMAQKYWLQRGEKIQNPFFGKQMAECGRLTSNLPKLAP